LENKNDSSEDSDQDCIPPKPSYNFNDTVYMKHYSKLESKCPPLSEWAEGLDKIWKKIWGFDSIIRDFIEKNKDDDEAVARIMTTRDRIHLIINCALMIDAYYTFDLKEINITYVESCLKFYELDYKEVIENSVKFIKRVNTALAEVSTDKNTEDRVVYRGVPAKLFPNVKVGDEFRIANFLSTSDEIEVAERFSKTLIGRITGTILTIEIPKRCCNAGKIKYYSRYPDESETLIPPYTSFKLVSRDGNNMHLVVAQDNSKAPFDKYSF
jgi:hypothetical protein